MLTYEIEKLENSGMLDTDADVDEEMLFSITADEDESLK